MLESLFLKLPADAQAYLSVPCVLEDIMPGFCRGALPFLSHVEAFRVAAWMFAAILFTMVCMAECIASTAPANKASQFAVAAASAC